MNAIFYKKGLSTMSFEFDLTITGIDTLLYNEQRTISLLFNNNDYEILTYSN